MTDEAWSADYAKIIGLMLCGDAIALENYKGEPVRDGTFLLFLNAHHEDFEVGLPGHAHVRWRVLIDTATEEGFVADGPRGNGGGRHRLTSRSLVLFQQDAGTSDEARDIKGRRMTKRAAK
jgi:glycogen operon protein